MNNPSSPFGDKPTAVDSSVHVFRTDGSSGSNPRKLAQLISVIDMAFNILGWDIPLKDKDGNIIRNPVLFSTIIVSNQASIDAKYHDDYVKIASLDEYIKKRALSRRISTNEQMADNTNSLL